MKTPKLYNGQAQTDTGLFANPHTRRIPRFPRR